MGLTNNLGKLSNMITSTGSAVGIAQSSPSYTLDVTGTARFTNTVTGTSWVGNANYTFASYYNASSTLVGTLGTIGAQTGSGIFTDFAIVSLANFAIFTGNYFAPSLYINSSRNVGIGTTSPSFSSGGGLAISNSTRSNLSLTDGTNSFNIFQDSTSAYLNVYSSGDLIFRTTTGNTERMRLTNTGNLGIGTNSPQVLLHLYDASLPRLQFSNSTTGIASTDGFQIYQSGLTAIVTNKEAGDVVFGTSDTERMRITSGGNVLIGASNDAYNNLLALLQSNSASATTLQITNSSNASTTTKTAQVMFNISDTGNTIKNAANVVAIPTSVNVLGADLAFGTRSGDGNPPIERMRITSSGNVGIGINPQWTLANYRTLELSDIGLIYAGSGNMAFVNNGYYDGAWKYKQSAYPATLYSTDSGAHQFYTAGISDPGAVISWSEKMRITNQGSVLIGASSTSGVARLEVTGAMYAKGSGSVIYFDSQNTSVINAWYAASAQIRLYNNGYGIIGYFTESNGAYTAASDYNMKKNIVDSSNALDIVSKIKVRSYDWKATDIHEPFGVVAQELYEVAPTYVSKPIDDDSKWGVSKAEMVPMLIKAIQEQQQQIEELKSLINK